MGNKHRMHPSSPLKEFSSFPFSRRFTVHYSTRILFYSLLIQMKRGDALHNFSTNAGINFGGDDYLPDESRRVSAA